MPFLEGSRQCVGMSLARMTTAATVAALLSRFTFRLADEVRAVLRVRVRVQ
jgi:cytochrome P450